MFKRKSVSLLFCHTVYVNNTEDNCRELAMYISNVVGVQNVRRDKCRTIFFVRRLE